MGTSRLDVKGEMYMAYHMEKSTNARHWGGTARSSDEAAVMEVERRGCAK